jgi:thymidylate synthase ThyX
VTISTEIILDSINPAGARVTTFVLRYPRFIHAELMTHRAFSRNASSSRAIPFNRLVKDTWADIAYPIEFKANQKGMQAGEALSPWRESACRAVWATHSYVSGGLSWIINKLGAHKQYANRLIEPTGHISVVLTATEFANWFALRYHPAAQPEICQLARQMWEAYVASDPQTLLMGYWHLPFVTNEEIMSHFASMGNGVVGSNNIEHWLPLIKKSVARCARVSYLTHEKKRPTEKEDFDLYERLVGSQPIHASPAEHQACAVLDRNMRSGNLKGFLQFRKTLANENIEVFDAPLPVSTPVQSGPASVSTISALKKLFRGKR